MSKTRSFFHNILSIKDFLHQQIHYNGIMVTSLRTNVVVGIRVHHINEPNVRKCTFGHVCSAKIQIRLHICTVYFG